MSELAERDPQCVERWPDCESGTYDPRCCRFPKSCSCTVIAQERRDRLAVTMLDEVGE